MTVDEAKELKSGAKVHDMYFNRKGEVFNPSDKGFMVRYEHDNDEFVSFDDKESINDFVKL